jgi:hypothetical protein
MAWRVVVVAWAGTVVGERGGAVVVVVVEVGGGGATVTVSTAEAGVPPLVPAAVTSTL